MQCKVEFGIASFAMSLLESKLQLCVDIKLLYLLSISYIVMSHGCNITDQDGVHFLTFQIIEWVD